MFKNIKKFLTVSCLILVAWLLVMSAAIHFYTAGFYGWSTLLWGIVSFIVANVCIGYWENEAPDSRDLTEINMVTYKVVIVYLAISLTLNTVLCLIGFSVPYSRAIPTALNLVLLGIFIAVAAFLSPYRSRVARTAARTAAKTHASVQISARLSEIIAVTDDAETKTALKKLKEQVDYSSNISQPFTDRFEDEFRSLLDRIQNMVQKGDRAENILSEIQKADKLWKTRNGVGASIR